MEKCVSEEFDPNWKLYKQSWINIVDTTGAKGVFIAKLYVNENHGRSL